MYSFHPILECGLLYVFQVKFVVCFLFVDHVKIRRPVNLMNNNQTTISNIRVFLELHARFMSSWPY
jgi:hypothetical protein